MSRDPKVGDAVKIDGTIIYLSRGLAFVKIHRSYHTNTLLTMQCGALELNETMNPPSDLDAPPTMNQNLVSLYNRLWEGEFYDDHNESLELIKIFREHLISLGIKV